MVVPHRLERVGGLRRRVFGVRVVYVHAAAVGGDDVDDVELRLVGKHVGAGRGPLQTGAPRVVDGVLLTIVPAYARTFGVGGSADYVERQLHRIGM